jgi:hypothetical protein
LRSCTWRQAPALYTESRQTLWHTMLSPEHSLVLPLLLLLLLLL